MIRDASLFRKIVYVARIKVSQVCEEFLDYVVCVRTLKFFMMMKEEFLFLVWGE